jgi:predicted MarR family transcription regulator
VGTIKASSDDIACTLTRDDLKDVRAAWQKLFRTSLVSREPIPGGVRITVTPGGGAALQQLIDIERECCTWITFAVDGPSVALTAQGDGEQVIRAMWVADSVEWLVR